MLAVSARRGCSPWNAGPTQSVEDFVVAGDRDAASPRVRGGRAAANGPARAGKS